MSRALETAVGSRRKHKGGQKRPQLPCSAFLERKQWHNGSPPSGVIERSSACKRVHRDPHLSFTGYLQIYQRQSLLPLDTINTVKRTLSFRAPAALMACIDHPPSKAGTVAVDVTAHAAVDTWARRMGFSFSSPASVQALDVANPADQFQA